MERKKEKGKGIGEANAINAGGGNAVEGDGKRVAIVALRVHVRGEPMRFIADITGRILAELTAESRAAKEKLWLSDGRNALIHADGTGRRSLHLATAITETHYQEWKARIKRWNEHH